jgi:HAD superfamily hydrolase (TIGR01509 family)
MYDALLFDLDGTLIDTESIALETGLAAFAAHGHPVSRTFLESLVGKDDPTCEALVRTAYPGVDLVAVNRMRRAAFAEGVEQGLALKPGVSELLAAATRPCAIVTSSRREGAHRKLGIAGIARSFTHVVTLDDVTAPKPAPDPYLLAASLFGLEPGRCLVFEDSETGAEAAHRAGCVVVQVPDVVPSEGRWAHHLAPDLLTGARMAGLI